MGISIVKATVFIAYRLSMLFFSFLISGAMVALVTSKRGTCDWISFIKCIPPLNIGKIIAQEYNFQSFEKELVSPTWLCVNNLLHSTCQHTHDSPEMRLFIKLWDKMASKEFQADVVMDSMKLSSCHPLLGAQLWFCSTKAMYELKTCGLIDTYLRCAESAVQENCGQNITLSTVRSVEKDLRDFFMCPSKGKEDPLHMEL